MRANVEEVSMRLLMVLFALACVPVFAGCGGGDECVEGKACRCSNCTHTCGGAGHNCSFECTGGTCSFTCPGGHCATACTGGSTCTVACPGGGCGTSCTGAASCKVTGCTTGCGLTCVGTPTCENSCTDTAKQCGTTKT